MTLRIENRLDRIERELGMDDEMVEFDFGDEIVTMTGREFDELLHEIKGTRIMPHDTACVRSPEDTNHDDRIRHNPTE